MKKFEELKQELRHGDRQTIQIMTGIPIQTINAILGGWRSPKTPTGERILNAAEKIINSRKQLLGIGSTSELGDTPSRDVA